MALLSQNPSHVRWFSRTVIKLILFEFSINEIVFLDDDVMPSSAFAEEVDTGSSRRMAAARVAVSCLLRPLAYTLDRSKQFTS